MLRPPPISTLFPYTTLFRSHERAHKTHQYTGSKYYSRIHGLPPTVPDRKSTRLNSSHVAISYAVFCLKKKKTASSLESSDRSAANPRSRPRALARLINDSQT